MGRPRKYATDADRQAAYRSRATTMRDQVVPLVLTDLEQELVRYMLGAIWEECETHYDEACALLRRAGLLDGIFPDESRLPY